MFVARLPPRIPLTPEALERINQEAMAESPILSSLRSSLRWENDQATFNNSIARFIAPITSADELDNLRASFSTLEGGGYADRLRPLYSILNRLSPDECTHEQLEGIKTLIIEIADNSTSPEPEISSSPRDILLEQCSAGDADCHDHHSVVLHNLVLSAKIFNALRAETPDISKAIAYATEAAKLATLDDIVPEVMAYQCDATPPRRTRDAQGNIAMGESLEVLLALREQCCAPLDVSTKPIGGYFTSGGRLCGAHGLDNINMSDISYATGLVGERIKNPGYLLKHMIQEPAWRHHVSLFTADQLRVLSATVDAELDQLEGQSDYVDKMNALMRKRETQTNEILIQATGDLLARSGVSVALGGNPPRN